MGFPPKDKARKENDSRVTTEIIENLLEIGAEPRIICNCMN